MRVTHVITRLIVGGAQENTIASVLGLRQKPGVEVDLISGPSQGAEGSLESVFSDYPGVLRIVPELIRPIAPLSDWRAKSRLTAIFASDPPNIVHTHSGKAGILGRLAAARAGVPIIIHTIHGPSFGGFQGWISNLILRAAEVRAARVTTHFVVVADAMREHYLRAGIGRPDQYTRVFSGFDLDPFLEAANDQALRAQFGIAPGDIVVGKIARLFKLKGHEELIAAAPQLVEACPRLKFLLVGDGPWRHKFESQVRRAGLAKHFVFAGLVPPGTVPRMVGIMDLLVHLSLREGLARALPQALAASRPIVAYDCDGAREVCLEGQTGFLLQPGNRQQLIDRVLVLARDPSLRQRFGQRGCQYVSERFSVHRMVDELYRLYRNLSEPLRVPARPRA